MLSPSALKKLFFTIIIVLTVSVLGFSMATIRLEKNYSSFLEKVLSVFDKPHPLENQSDNISYCSIDSQPVHEIFLCGASDSRQITINDSTIDQIIWSKLEEGSCTAASEGCVNKSGACIWKEQSNAAQFTITSAGTYRIFVIYTDGSRQRFYVNIYSNGLKPTTVVKNVDCNSAGSITVNNIPPSYEFSLHPGNAWQASNIFSIAQAGAYNIKIRKKNTTDNCVFNLDDIIVGNSSIDAIATVSATTCGDNKGEIKVAVAGAAESYVYHISKNGNVLNTSGPIMSNEYTFSELGSGNYTVRVRLSDSNSCTWSVTKEISASSTGIINAVVTKNIDCKPGTITAAQTGGTPPYYFSIDNGITYIPFTDNNKTTIPINNAGSYSILSKDSNNCESNAPAITVSKENEIIYTINKELLTCNGTDDARIAINVTSTEGYGLTYSKDGGVTFQDSKIFSNLAAGSYSIILKKEKGGDQCLIDHGMVIIPLKTGFNVITKLTQEISCNTASATIEVTTKDGGTKPFTYSIDGFNFQASSTFSNLKKGDYTITVKDAKNCLSTTTTTIAASTKPTDLTFTSTADCYKKTATVAVTVVNGSAPFTYKITDPSTITSPDNTFANLAPKSYKFHVTDKNGCSFVKNYEVKPVIDVEVSVIVKNNVSCFSGTDDGTIAVTVNNFNASYEIEIRDSNDAITTHGASNITTNVHTVSNLAAGNYTLEVRTGTSTCSEKVTFEIKKPISKITVDPPVVTQISCGSLGSVSITSTGGWGNYQYAVINPDSSISTFQANTTINGLSQTGIYTVIVKDVNGCENKTRTFELTGDDVPEAVINLTTSNYCYSSTQLGILDLTISKGIAPYYYELNNAPAIAIVGTTLKLKDLTPDSYVLKIIDSKGCSSIVDDTEILDQFFAYAEITKSLGCGSSPNAEINVVTQNGYPDFTYEVSKDGGNYINASIPYSTAQVGTYIFRITDKKGCKTTTASITVAAKSTITATTNVTKTSCGISGSGAVNLVATGGVPPYQYSFDGAPFSNQTLYNGLDEKIYTYIIKDAVGCTATNNSVAIGATTKISATISYTDITCDPSSTTEATIWGNTSVQNIKNTVGKVTINLLAIRNIADYNATGWYTSYREYEDVDISSPRNITMYWSGWFLIEITDETGCIFKSDFFEITQPPFPIIDRSKVLDQTCANGATFDFEVGDPNNLLGPFRVKLWPFDIDGTTNNSYLPFDNNSNPLYNPSDTQPERNFRFTGLLFGVDYHVVIIDENTGCKRRLSLGKVDEPVDNTGFDAISIVKSESCRFSSDGEVTVIVKKAGDTDIDGTQTVQWRIYAASRPLDTNFHRSGTATDGGLGGDIEFFISNLRGYNYVLEVTSESGCTTGNHFPIHIPQVLRVSLLEAIPATCNYGAQISVKGSGGYEEEDYFNRRNSPKYQTGWKPLEYLFTVAGTDPYAVPDSLWSTEPNAIITPTAYDGVQNIYQVYVRDGGGCYKSLSNPITIRRDDVPSVDAIDVANRCTATNESYLVSATITDGEGVNVYIWNGKETTSKNQTLPPGKHTLVVRDKNGCTAREEIILYPQLVAKATVTKPVQCTVSNSGEVVIDVYGGSKKYTFERLDTGETNTTGIFTNLTDSVLYNFTVEDTLSGCVKKLVSTQLEAPALPDFKATVVQNVSCAGASDGVIVVEQRPSTINTDVAYTYSFDGITYQTSNYFNGLVPATNYKIYIKSSKNCVQELAPLTITSPTTLTLNTPSITNFECTTDNTLGVATIVASATSGTGTAPYLYSFDGNSYDTATSFEIPYTNTVQNVAIAVIDANNCTVQTMIQVPAATKLKTEIQVHQTMTCSKDGILDLIITNGSGTYTIAEKLSNTVPATINNNRITIPMGTPGTYIFNITDTATSCQNTVSHTIAPFDTLEITKTTKLSDITCLSSATGAFEFKVAGFSPDFDYEIFKTSDTTNPYRAAQTSTATTAIEVAALPVGTYYVLVTDSATDCFVSSEHITIQSPTFPLDVALEITKEARCNPANDVEITAIATGGWGTHTYQVTNTTTNTVLVPYGSKNVFDGLDAGATYLVAVKDKNGCENNLTTITVGTLDQITINPTLTVVQQPSCFGLVDGSISITAEGGEGDGFYQYILNNKTDSIDSAPQSSNTFSNLTPGEYTVNVYDNLGCAATTAPIILINPEEVAVAAYISKTATCLLNGEITVSATGGSGSYEYKIIAPPASVTGWSANTVYVLNAGSYEFAARDTPNGCISPITVTRTLQEVKPLTVTLDTSNASISCFGADNAVIIAKASGGIGYYQYQIEKDGVLIGSMQNTGTFQNLSQGIYRVSVTGGMDCEVLSTSTTIIEPPVLSAEVRSKTDVLCYGEDTGAITVSASGGVAPYKYSISTALLKPSTKNTFTNLTAGSYTVFIQDLNGCEFQLPFTITGPAAPLQAAITKVENELCASDSNGLIALAISGGIAPYTYSINNGSYNNVVDASSLKIENLAGGEIHTILIKDANGCIVKSYQEILEGENLNARIEMSYVCEAFKPANSTTVILENTAISKDVLYALDSKDIARAQASPTFKNLTVGSHYISVLHKDGCVLALDPIIIEEQEALTLMDVSTNLNEIKVEGLGGDGSYTYNLDGAQNKSGIFRVLATNTYTISVTDGRGCQTTLQVYAEFIDIDVPNFFTPDGDGIRDVWRIKNSEAYPNISVKIFDRYGRKLKEFIGEGTWDGSYTDESLPTGGYWYIINLNEKEDARDFIGSITLYR